MEEHIYFALTCNFLPFELLVLQFLSPRGAITPGGMMITLTWNFQSLLSLFSFLAAGRCGNSKSLPKSVPMFGGVLSNWKNCTLHRLPALHLRDSQEAKEEDLRAESPSAKQKQWATKFTYALKMQFKKCRFLSPVPDQLEVNIESRLFYAQ